MANKHEDRDVFNPSRREKTEQNVPTGTSKENSMLHMEMKAPPAMMNLYQYTKFAKSMSVNHEVELQKERKIVHEVRPQTANKSQALSWMHLKNDTELTEDFSVARHRCALPIKYTTRTCSLGEEKVPAQSSHRSRTQPLGNIAGNVSNDESRHRNDMDKTPEDSSIDLKTTSKATPQKQN